MARMLLAEDLRRLPPLRGQEGNRDPVVYVRFFSPFSHWVWLVTEYDPGEELFFGLVLGFEEEWGYFSLQELSAANVRGVPLVERDRHFRPRPLSQVRSAA